MLSIAIYSNQINDAELLKSKIQDYLINTKTLAKITMFDSRELFIACPHSFDVYFMDMECNDDVIKLGKQMMDIDHKSRFIYFSSFESNAYYSAKIRADYFLKKPIDPEDVEGILSDIKKEIKNESVIIQTAAGERKVYVQQLNYVNITKRCLSYHLMDCVFEGQTLRGSFEKAITPLQNNPMLLFLHPSLLINLNNIKELSSDHIIFENDDITYFPKKAYDTIREKWLKLVEK